MSKKQANAEHGIHTLFGDRWSPRAFDRAQDVRSEDLASCLEAARWAPSCFGAEPWRFVVCQRSQDEQTWRLLLACLAPKNQAWAQNDPVLMMVCTDTLFAHNGSPNRWAEYDAGQATVSLSLQATALGLVSHQMGGFDVEQVRQTLGVPEQFTPMAALALGYLGEASHLDSGVQEVEQAPRGRKPLADIAFMGGWAA